MFENVDRETDDTHKDDPVINTLIKSSNRSVLKISFLKNYIFLPNQIYST